MTEANHVNWTELREQYRNDGVVFLKDALDVNSMRLAQEAYEWSLAHPSPAATTIAQNTPGKFYQDLANPKALPAYERLLAESPAADDSVRKLLQLLEVEGQHG